MILGPLHVFLHLAELGVMPWPYPYEAPRIPPAPDASGALAVLGGERGEG